MTWEAPIYLKAPAEADLIAAVPMLHSVAGPLDASPGTPGWLYSGPYHALVCPVPIMQADGTLEPGCHANLRLDSGHPQHDAIMAGVAPYVVTPAHPQMVWA